MHKLTNFFNMRHFLSGVVIFFLLATACVPIRRETYIGVPDLSSIEENQVIGAYRQAQDYEYRLQPNDIVSVKVASSTASEFNFLSYQREQQMGDARFNDPLLSGFDIGPDGTILLPVIGKVDIAGLTLDHAREKVRLVVAEYLETPTVDIKLLSFQVTVLGEVEQEGTFVVYNPRLSILDALGRAGGLTDFGDPQKVKIVRHQGDSLEVVYVNVMEEDILASPYYFLRPNDVVAVPGVPGKNLQKYNLTYLQILLTGLTAVGVFFNVFQRPRD